MDGTAVGKSITCMSHLSFLFQRTVLHWCCDDKLLSFVVLCLTTGQDYMGITNQRLGPFGNKDRRRCFTVDILRDTNRAEDPEDFMVVVTFCPGEAVPPNTVINPRNATTTIIDCEFDLVLYDCMNDCGCLLDQSTL